MYHKDLKKCIYNKNLIKEYYGDLEKYKKDREDYFNTLTKHYETNKRYYNDLQFYYYNFYIKGHNGNDCNKDSDYDRDYEDEDDEDYDPYK